MSHKMKEAVSWCALAAACLMPAAMFAAAQPQKGRPLVYPVLRGETSLPLRQIPPVHPRIGREVVPLRAVPRPTSAPQPDPVVQSSAQALVGTSISTNFEGLGAGFPGFNMQAAPPDTNGAVGDTQYVQWVNLSYAVFDKSGNSRSNPIEGNTLWQGSGLTACATTNDGDPTIQYDSMAGRWVAMQLSYSSGTGYYECIAISKTDDFLGEWYRYALQWTSTLPDYPKLGIWPDAYYVTENMFLNGFVFVGGEVCALDRSKMLDGLDATAQCYLLSSYPSLLPSTVDGTPPPASSPDYLMDLGSNSLNLFKFHVDFSNTNNSSLTGPINIPVAAFTSACGGGVCIPQPGTSQQLDSLADRLMYRLAYRNFGDHESLVATHSVDPNGGSTGGGGHGHGHGPASPEFSKKPGGGHGGGSSTAVSAIRWYEIRSPNSTPTVYQQGTYSPDTDSRWMGSIAMDKAGDIAVGYSVSSSSTYPSIRYTGRVPNDTLGTLEGEASVVDGNGSQEDSQTPLSRWGDYSSMSVDPVDGCTFWYTTEYIESNGTFNWHTRIATFKFPGCN
jgi:hypothetical protein